MSSEERILLQMKHIPVRMAASVTWLLGLAGLTGALAPTATAGQPTDFSEYFRLQTAAIEQTCLAGVHSRQGDGFIPALGSRSHLHFWGALLPVGFGEWAGRVSLPRRSR